MGKPKHQPRSQQRQKGRGLLPLTHGMEEMVREVPRKAVAFEPKNEAQAQYAEMINTQSLVFGIGPAGVGKSFVAGTIAAEMLLDGRVKRIIITRPICEAGEELGFLPGDMMEKVGPYAAPMISILERRLGASHVELLMKSKKIEFLPLAYMRGASIDDAVMILDEAQNTTPAQMKLFLTRMGEGSIMIIDGDPTQLDLAPGQKSGLVDGIVKTRGLDGVAIQTFTSDDIVRSGLVKAIVRRYEKSNPAFEREIADAIRGDFEPTSILRSIAA